MSAKGKRVYGPKDFSKHNYFTPTDLHNLMKKIVFNDFFNAEAYPNLTFESTSFTKTGDSTYKLVGNFTMRDVTKPIELQVEYGGTATDPWGNVKAGFEINGKISRNEYGLKWNALTEAGGAVVSDEVKLHLNVQLIKQA